MVLVTSGEKRVSHLGHTLRTSPVALGWVCDGGQEAESVVVVVATVAQQQFLVIIAASTHPTHKRVHLRVGAREGVRE